MELEKEKDIAKAQNDFIKSYRKKEVRHQIVITAATVIIYLFMFIILSLCSIRIVKVENNAMKPTFESGETILINQLAYLIRSPKPGEVVLFEHEDEIHVGRVIAAGPGKLELKDGEVFWNDVLLEEAYLNKTDVTPSYTSDVINLKNGEVFILGDNRALLYEEDGLIDSRNIAVPLEIDQIKGKLIQ